MKTLQNMLNGGCKAGKCSCPQTRTETESCGDKLGFLPNPAPLANPYVPFQNNNPARYEAGKGLIRGTLFPGLDLPFMGMVNEQEKGDSGLAELQTLAFAMGELGLYLDTHKDDLEAAALMRSYAELYRQGLRVWQEQNGPIYQMFAADTGSYQWLNGPWPWEYAANACREG